MPISPQRTESGGAATKIDLKKNGFDREGREEYEVYNQKLPNPPWPSYYYA